MTMVNARMIFRRVLGLLGIALLLASSSADALGLHRCDHHDALPGAPAESHGHHGHDEAPASEETSGGCTCIGTCSTTGVALVPALRAHAVDVLPASFRGIDPARSSMQPLSPEHLLPFATAP